MTIRAKGKNIPAYEMGHLFRQGEKYAETICFEVDRFYNGIDLGECSFMIRGVNEDNGEAQQALVPEISGEKLLLSWNVSEYFTAASGRLLLELRASGGGGDIILKYNIAPIEVAPSPEGENVPLPSAAEQVISEINAAASDGIAGIQTVIDSFDLEATERRLDAMEENIGIFLARPEVIAVTAEEYESISHKENSLYVIVKE